MTMADQTWPAETLDAIGIWISRSQIEVVGTDDDVVRLHSDDDGWYPQVIQPDDNQRWLALRYWEDHRAPSQLTLFVPRNKAWVIDISGWKVNVTARSLQARLMVATQRGDVQLSDVQGVAAVKAGDGNIEVKGYVEREMPERPGMPSDPNAAPFSTPQPGFGFPGPDDWYTWSPQDWTEWGSKFGEQINVWAQQFGSFWNQIGWQWPKSGLNLHAGKGDIQLTGAEARSCLVRTSKGNIEVKESGIANLSITTHHGDVQVSSTYPSEIWELKTTHGNIQLALPADTQARLDAATRQGDVRSEVPLVRVARPGPESRRGGRMVGTLGAAEGTRAQISLATMHGDIEIQLRPPSRRIPPAPAPREAPTPAAAAPVPPVPQAPEAPEPPAYPYSDDLTAQGIVDLADQDVPEAGPSVGEDAPAEEPAPSAAPAPEDPVMAILQALRDGAITVEEADRLLEQQMAGR